MEFSAGDSLKRVQDLLTAGAISEAEAACNELVQKAPQEPLGWVFSGGIALQTNRPALAEQAFREAVRLRPEDSNSWHHLSIALHAQGRAVDAEQCSRKAVALNQSQPAFWLQLGIALFAQERFEEAVSAFHTSLSHDPFNAITWENLGAAEYVQNRFDEARSAFEESLTRASSRVETRLKLASTLEKLWLPCEAGAIVHEVVRHQPQQAEAWTMLGRIQLSTLRQQEAIDSLRRAMEVGPNAATHSRLLQGMQYVDDITAAALFDAHHAWNGAHAPIGSSALSPTACAAEPGRRIRIGFLSGDFGINPIGFLALPLLEHLDKSKCSVVCYFDRRGGDTLTARFRQSSDLWRVTHGLSTEQLVQQIRADEIDVLVDLMGHTGNRLPTFFQKPAPMQVTWLGYVGTTGVRAMDFLLADRFHVRSGEEANYAETVLRMPHGYACYGPPTNAPEVGPLPALTTGYVTFGCFNNPAKYSRAALDAWSEILRRIPTARLLLKYGGLAEPAMQDRLRAEFSRRGVANERISLEGWSKHAELLASYNQIDLALDTQPYSGGLTTCEALWMGIPVITCPGQTFAGRHSTSHLANSGYEQFIAADMAGYVHLAENWASRLEDLAAVRAEMREKVHKSRLCNAASFATDFLSAVQNAWMSKTGGRASR